MPRGQAKKKSDAQTKHRVKKNAQDSQVVHHLVFVSGAEVADELGQSLVQMLDFQVPKLNVVYRVDREQFLADADELQQLPVYAARQDLDDLLPGHYSRAVADNLPLLATWVRRGPERTFFADEDLLTAVRLAYLSRARVLIVDLSAPDITGQTQIEMSLARKWGIPVVGLIVSLARIPPIVLGHFDVLMNYHHVRGSRLPSGKSPAQVISYLALVKHPGRNT